VAELSGSRLVNAAGDDDREDRWRTNQSGNDLKGGGPARDGWVGVRSCGSWIRGFGYDVIRTWNLGIVSWQGPTGFPR
jgi:hypothetical protein